MGERTLFEEDRRRLGLLLADDPRAAQDDAPGRGRLHRGVAPRASSSADRASRTAAIKRDHARSAARELIRKAPHPYADDLIIVTKIGTRRGADGSWQPALSPKELTQAVHDNLQNLGLNGLDVVNLRSMFGSHGPAEGSIEEPLSALADLQRKGLVRHIGLSNVTPAQIEEGRRICEIVCVQNHYNVAQRADDALIDELSRHGIAYVPFFPLGGFTPVQSSTLSGVARRFGATPMQVALAWLLRRAHNILLIPGTSSSAHVRESLAVAELDLPQDAVMALDRIGAHTEAAA